MNIQMSSSARLDRGNLGRSANVNFRSVNKALTKILENSRKFLLIACLFALAIDPLFLFIPEINSTKTCFKFDKKLGKIVCVLRTLNDAFYAIHIIVSFIIEVFVSDPSLSMYSKAARKISIPSYLIVDIVSVLPIPQLVVLSLIIRSTSPVPKRQLISFTKWILVGQYLPRIIRIYPLYKKVTRTSATIAESNWLGAGFNLLLFMLCSYVFGAFWYVNAIEKKTKCWRDACNRNKTLGCNTMYLFCQKIDNSRFLNTSCPLIEPEEITKLNTTSYTVFDFGMYIEVLESKVVEAHPRDFPRKFVYCFWWGLRNLSTFGESLKPGNSATDIFFAIIICASGLFLFAVLIGNVQKYMISSTVRVEEMKERKRDTEKWMSSRALPEELQERIRKYDNYKWREFRGTEEDALLRSLPKDLRLETKTPSLPKSVKVPLLAILNDWVLEAVCDRVKSVFYLNSSCIVKEGHPVEEMLIVTKGKLKCTTKYSDHYDTSELKEGDVCGDLLLWILNPTPSPHLPISNRTVMTTTDVEGFILSPDDLKFVATHLDRVQTVKVKELFRSLSEKRRSGCSSTPADPEISKDEA